MTEIKGLEQLISKLNNLPEKLEKKVIRAAVRKGAILVRDKAREKAPVKTGTLKKSIKIRSNKVANGIISFKIGPTNDKKKGTDVFYGRFIEFGTSKMAAKPFMRPALDESETEVLNVVIDNVKSKLEEGTK
ncbi:HK97-gp10 family putative phage morphogenesis protein [Sulfurospirillum cavolei]|uniref:HK97-gp10 family putative phage morphogenesis protein n=1 Tax=Sulfurospirillum cavolei TaxID=366522 RepID=UPI003FA31785